MNVFEQLRSMVNGETVKGTIYCNDYNERIPAILFKDDYGQGYVFQDKLSGSSPSGEYNLGPFAFSWALFDHNSNFDPNSWSGESSTRITNDLLNKTIISRVSSPEGAAMNPGDEAVVIDVDVMSKMVRVRDTNNCVWSFTEYVFANAHVVLKEVSVTKTDSPSIVTDLDYLFKLYLYWDLLYKSFQHKEIYVLADWKTDDGREIAKKGSVLRLEEVNSYGGLIFIHSSITKAHFHASLFGPTLTIFEKDKVSMPVPNPNLRKDVSITLLKDKSGFAAKTRLIITTLSSGSRFFTASHEDKHVSLCKFEIGDEFYITPIWELEKPKPDVPSGVTHSVSAPDGEETISVKHMKPIVHIAQEESTSLVKTKHHKAIVMRDAD